MPTALQDIVRRERTNLLQFTCESFPWTARDETSALAQFLQFAIEERSALAPLVQYLSRQREPVPYTGTYPMSFTALGFVSLEHLLPMLLDAHSRDVASLESDLKHVNDQTPRQLAQNLLDTKRRHLDKLKELAGAHPLKYSTVR